MEQLRILAHDAIDEDNLLEIPMDDTISQWCHHIIDEFFSFDRDSGLPRIMSLIRNTMDDEMIYAIDQGVMNERSFTLIWNSHINGSCFYEKRVYSDSIHDEELVEELDEESTDEESDRYYLDFSSSDELDESDDIPPHGSMTCDFCTGHVEIYQDHWCPNAHFSCIQCSNLWSHVKDLNHKYTGIIKMIRKVLFSSACMYADYQDYDVESSRIIMVAPLLFPYINLRNKLPTPQDPRTITLRAHAKRPGIFLKVVAELFMTYRGPFWRPGVLNLNSFNCKLWVDKYQSLIEIINLGIGVDIKISVNGSMPHKTYDSMVICASNVLRDNGIGLYLVCPKCHSGVELVYSTNLTTILQCSCQHQMTIQEIMGIEGTILYGILG